MANRRSFLQSALGIGAGLFATDGLFASSSQSSTQKLKAARHSGKGLAFSTPVVTTDIGDLPFTMDGDVKVFHLIAQVVKQQIAPDKTIDSWGFNGSAP